MQIVEKESSLNSFLSSMRNEKGTVVGVYYKNAMIDESILAEASLQLEVPNKTEKVLQATVALKPMPSQVNQLTTLESLLEDSGMGWFFDRERPITPTMSTPLFNDLAISQSALSNIQNYRLVVNMADPKVTKQTFTFYKNTYTLFKVEDRQMDSKVAGNIIHSIHVLYKEEQYDGETLFGRLFVESGSKEAKLMKRDTKILLDLLCDENVTSLFIGGIELSLEDRLSNAKLFPLYTAVTATRTNYDAYRFLTDSGETTIVSDTILESKLIKVADYKFTFTVKLKGNAQLTIYLG
ncbi:hypothetical protein [Listeria phage LMTA-148]|uniref:Uncharacterized protein n=1 Tax=Listeria phage LMTA-148 TaxID=1486413 RepID=A0A068CC16_9CAUD|nr:hypothetical protein LD12_gp077 [Listeria phage LMTA-148]AID17444.1 hypothetical protein [Listeria phage LMTA-148]